MNRIDTPFPLNKEEYEILILLIKIDYGEVRFFDRYKRGNSNVCFSVNKMLKIEKKDIVKLREINRTIKTKYYWCEKESSFLYFYEINNDNNWTYFDYKLVRKLNENNSVLI